MSSLKKYIPKKLLPLVIWLRNGPVADLETIGLVLFPIFVVSIRWIRKAITLSFWIKEEGFKKSVAVDVRKLGNSSDQILKNFAIVLLNLANSNRKNRPMHLSVEVPAEYFKLVTDLQALTKTLPQTNYGDAEFFVAHEDRVAWQREISNTENTPEEILPSEIDFLSLEKKLVPPAHYQNWARGFLKALGGHRKVYFCNFETSPDNLFEDALKFQGKCIFLVNTPIEISLEKHYQFGNVIYLSRLGLSVSEKLALVHLCDGYLGLSDLFEVFAKQKNVVMNSMKSSRELEGELFQG